MITSRPARWLAAASLLVAAVAMTSPAARAEDSASAEPREEDEAIAALLPLGFRTPASPLVRDGLRGLAAAQKPSGAWSASEGGNGNEAFDVGVTGLALLAFLGAGYGTDGPEPYAKCVASGVRHLLEQQDAQGCFGERTHDHFIYNHAFASLAVVEAYALTGSADLRDRAQKAIRFIELARNPYFAWRYGVRTRDNDTSVSGCVFSVLAAARAINRAAERGRQPVPFELDDDAAEGVRAWIDKMTDPDYGRLGYQKRGTGSSRLVGLEDRFPQDRTEAMTAIGIVARVRLGVDPKTPLMRASMALCLKQPPVWDEAAGAIDLYYWYYGSQAMFLMGSEAWKPWSAALGKALTTGAVQSAQGVAWNPDEAWRSQGGSIYATSMALLCLETERRCHREPSDASKLVAAAGDASLEASFRLRALRFLAIQPQKGSLTTLLNALVSKSPEFRIAAARALGAMGPSASGALPALESATKAEDESVRAAAEQAIERIKAPARAPGAAPAASPSGAPPARPASAAARVAAADLGDAAQVAELLKASDTAERTWKTLVVRGKESAPVLLVVARGEASLRARALDVVRALDADAAGAAEAFLAAATDKDKAVRAAGLAGLGKTSRPPAETRDVLLRALDDPEASVCRAALGTLRLRKDGDAAAAAAVGRLLSHADDAAAASAADVLAQWRIAEPTSIEALEHALDRKGELAPRAVVAAIGALAAKEPRLITALERVLADAKHPGFYEAFEAMKALGERAAVSLARIFASSDGDTRYRARRALVDLGPKAAPALPVLLKSLPSTLLLPLGDAHDWGEVCRAIGRPAVDALVAALSDDRINMRANAATLLGELKAAARSALGPLSRAKSREREPDVLKAIDSAIDAIERAPK